MPAHPNDTNGPVYALNIAELVLPAEEKERAERAANGMARKVDSIAHLDPLDVEPAVVFNPGG